MEVSSGSEFSKNYTKDVLLFGVLMINEDNRELGYLFT